MHSLSLRMCPKVMTMMNDDQVLMVMLDSLAQMVEVKMVVEVVVVVVAVTMNAIQSEIALLNLVLWDSFLAELSHGKMSS